MGKQEAFSLIGPPRPKAATNLIDNYKKEHGSFDEAGERELQIWDLQDKCESAQNGIIGMTFDYNQQTL
jgi:hypothetical protein